jgi:hypothetical protein
VCPYVRDAGLWNGKQRTVGRWDLFIVQFMSVRSIRVHVPPSGFTTERTVPPHASFHPPHQAVIEMPPFATWSRPNLAGRDNRCLLAGSRVRTHARLEGDRPREGQ